METYHQKYYRENIDKFKEYNSKHKQIRLERSKKWQKDNPKKAKELNLKSIKKNNYKSEKTLKQRKLRMIKRKTRFRYPLEGNQCSCGQLAQCRHHTTNPIEADKFIFMCNPCHKDHHIEQIKLMKGG